MESQWMGSCLAWYSTTYPTSGCIDPPRDRAHPRSLDDELHVRGRQLELSEAARAISGVVSSTGEIPPIFSEADVVIISVRDERVPEVAERLVKERLLRPQQVLLHTSGAYAAGNILAVARPHVRAVGTLHPLVSFADPRVAVEGLTQVAFGIEGDEPARQVAKRIVRALGARAVFLDAENLPLYHAGAVMASNYVVALADMAQSLLVKAGVPQEQALPALIPLLSSVVEPVAARAAGRADRAGRARRRLVGGAAPQDHGVTRAGAAGALPAGRDGRAAAGAGKIPPRARGRGAARGPVLGDGGRRPTD
jgi:pyrroline-5-carboxylate reductase